MLTTHACPSPKIYFTIPATSMTIAKTWQCDTYVKDAEGETESFLRADGSVSCDNASYQFLTRYAMVQMFIFPIGVPLAGDPLYRSRFGVIHSPPPPLYRSDSLGFSQPIT